MTEFTPVDPPAQPPPGRVRLIMGIAIALFLGVAIWGVGFAKGQWGQPVAAPEVTGQPTGASTKATTPVTTQASPPGTNANPPATKAAVPPPASTPTSASPTTTKASVTFPAGARICADGPVRAAAGTPRTTCTFATAVRDAYVGSGASGSTSVRAYSAVTKQTYTMNCVAGTHVTCRGANNAIVYLGP